MMVGNRHMVIFTRYNNVGISTCHSRLQKVVQPEHDNKKNRPSPNTSRQHSEHGDFDSNTDSLESDDDLSEDSERGEECYHFDDEAFSFVNM